MAILNNSNAISSGGYDINNSLRLRSSASAYLSRTPASAGNSQKLTLECMGKKRIYWCKLWWIIFIRNMVLLMMIY
jgi:hypothetical protein